MYRACGKRFGTRHNRIATNSRQLQSTFENVCWWCAPRRRENINILLVSFISLPFYFISPSTVCVVRCIRKILFCARWKMTKADIIDFNRKYNELSRESIFFSLLFVAIATLPLAHFMRRCWKRFSVAWICRLSMRMMSDRWTSELVVSSIGMHFVLWFFRNHSSHRILLLA